MAGETSKEEQTIEVHAEVLQIIQVIPAAAGWRLALAREVMRRDRAGKTINDGWRVHETPVACFALCDVAYLDAEGKERGNRERRVLPVAEGEAGLAPFADTDLISTRLIGPGFEASAPNAEGLFELRKSGTK